MTAIALHTDDTEVRGPLRERLVELQAMAAPLDAKGLLRLALKEAFPGRTAIVSSFAAESVVLLHLVAAIDPETPILFLNTGKLLGEDRKSTRLNSSH